MQRCAKITNKSMKTELVKYITYAELLRKYTNNKNTNLNLKSVQLSSRCKC